MKYILIIFLLIEHNCSAQNPINSSLMGRDEGKNILNSKSGILIEQFTILKGNLEGEFLQYYNNGKLQKRLEFTKGEFNGLSCPEKS